MRCAFLIVIELQRSKIGFLTPMFIKILTILEKEQVHGVDIKGWEWVAFSLDVGKNQV